MDEFSQQAIKVFKALADPVRYKIIQLLSEQGELGAADLSNVFDISAPAMSHHYRILENADLVSSRKSGQHVFLRLEEATLNKTTQQLGKTLSVSKNKKFNHMQ